MCFRFIKNTIVLVAIKETFICKNRLVQYIAIFIGLIHCTICHCQADESSYPSKNIKLYINVPAGGTTDQVSRYIAEKLSNTFNPYTVTPINLDGAGGLVAERYLRTTPADGYALLATPPGILLNPSQQENTQTAAPLKPVIVAGYFPNAIIARPSLPYKTLGELIQGAKKNRTTLTCASQGVGTTSHLNCLKFSMLTGIDIIHVPFRGTGPALLAILGNQVDLFFGNPQIALGQYEQKKLLILAIMDRKKLANAPQIPTVHELKYPGLHSLSWIAIMAPPGTPLSIATKLNLTLQKIIGSPASRQFLSHLNVNPVGGDLSATRLFIQQEVTENQLLLARINKQFGSLEIAP